jgi:hypothetical protein
MRSQGGLPVAGVALSPVVGCSLTLCSTCDRRGRPDSTVQGHVTVVLCTLPCLRSVLRLKCAVRWCHRGGAVHQRCVTGMALYVMMSHQGWCVTG